MKRILAVLLISAFFLKYGYSGHIVGGELTYTCLDSNTYLYEVKLELFRDCAGGGAVFDYYPASSGFEFRMHYFNSDNDTLFNRYYTHGPITDLDPTGNDPCLTILGNVCVQETFYLDTLILPPRPGGYLITYQRSTRNEGLLNIIDPELVGSVFTASVPDTSLAKCNSSPEFINFPPIAICVDRAFTFDHSAFDPDGDSLVYELCDPLQTNSIDPPNPTYPAILPPFNPVPWAAGFSALNPLAGSIAIDRFTGEMNAFPTALGKYLVGVCVKEYRNDTLLSIHFRDFQFNIVDCINPTAAIFDFEKICGELTVNFPDESDDADTYFWDFGDTTTLGDTSLEASPSYTYPDTGKYTVTLIVNPGTACTDTAYQTIELKPGLEANFTASDNCLGELTDFTDNSIAQDGFITDWHWDFGNGDNTSGENIPPYLYDSPGVYNSLLIITSNHGCMDTVTRKIRIYPLPIFNLRNDTAICFGDTMCFPFGDGSIDTFDNKQITTNYIWQPMTNLLETNSSLTCVFPDENIQYTVTATNNLGCSFMDDLYIEVFPSPIIVAAPDEILIDRGDTVPLIATGGEIYVWTPNTELSNDTIADPIAYPLRNKLYKVRGTDANGCHSIDSILINVRIEPQIFPPTAFSPGDKNGMNDVFSLINFDIRQVNTFQIYNRWGTKVFEGNNISDSWDGTYNGKLQPVGLYILIIDAIGLDGDQLLHVGTITLLR